MGGTGTIAGTLKDGVLHLELARPERLNALLEPMRERLCEQIEALRDRPEVRVCVISGRGRGFCAGGDVEVMANIIEEGHFEEVQTFLAWGRRIVEGIRAAPVPVIAAIHGPAAGAGMNLALACDLRIASTSATFAQSFVHIGLHTDWGGSWFLPRLVGSAKALELLWTGRPIDAAEALRLGLLNELVAPDDLAPRVSSLAARLAALPRELVATTKRGVYGSQLGTLGAALDHEAQAQDRCLRSGAAREGMERFLARRRSR